MHAVRHNRLNGVHREITLSFYHSGSTSNRVCLTARSGSDDHGNDRATSDRYLNPDCDAQPDRHADADSHAD